MLMNDIGTSAGIIWQLLFEKGVLSVRKIGEMTGLRDVTIALAVGWLAREDKIKIFSKYEDIYIELISRCQEIYY